MPCNFSCLVRRPRQGETLKGGESGLPRPGRRELDPHLRPCQHRSYLRFHTSTRASARAWMHMSCATEPPEYPCKPCHSAVVRCTRAPKQVCMPSFATHHLFLLLSIIYCRSLSFFSDGRTHTYMNSFSADALRSICQLIMLWQQ